MSEDVKRLVPEDASSPITRDREKLIEDKAARLGCSIVLGDSRTLLVDCDSQESFDITVQNLRWAKGLLGIQKAWHTRSRSNRWHVYIKLGMDMSQRERALMQAAIGGDFKRAILDWRRTELTEPMGEATIRQLLVTGKKSEVGRGETILFETSGFKETPIDLGPEFSINY